ncbi:MAG: hypothetical protein ACKO7N_05990 [Candidatus Nitrosotenuis sp.]
MKNALMFLLVVIVSFHYAMAESVSIKTDKSTYSYGDYLSVTISVAKLTGKNAFLYIIDSTGKSSSAIPVKITKEDTTITTPVPFSKEIFKQGNYQIQVEYGDTKVSSNFRLVDSGNIVMPFGSNIIVTKWVDGTISDKQFLKFLMNNELIKFTSEQQLQDQIVIPNWYKINAKWWSDRKISDSDLIKGIQYLVNQKII